MKCISALRCVYFRLQTELINAESIKIFLKVCLENRYIITSEEKREIHVFLLLQVNYSSHATLCYCALKLLNVSC